MSAIRKNRRPPQKDDGEEDQGLVSDGLEEMYIDVAGKFQMSRTIKYNHEQNKWAKWVYHSFEMGWIIYVMFLGASAGAELGYANPSLVWPFYTWAWLLTSAAIVKFIWWVAAVACATRNAIAVKNNASELPCMELRHTVSWTTVLLGLWVWVMAMMWQVWLNRVSPNTDAQQTSFITKMWMVVIIVIVNLLDWVRHVARMALDYMLIACGSPCYDL